MTRARVRWILLGLTLLAAALRLTFLNHPALWGDEVATYSRVRGSFESLIQLLKETGFTPLHYEATWLTVHTLGPWPWVLRLLPAVSGVLIVPAIWFLARQLLNEHAALLAAAIAAASAFLSAHSRDAKMYMDFWLACTVNAACLLWWMQSRRRVAWWSWTASGVAMAGLQASGLVLLGVELVIVLTHRESKWWKTLLFVLGTIVIVSGPAVYYVNGNHWTQRVQRSGYEASGILWARNYTRDRGFWELARFVGAAHLYGWEWPRESDRTSIRNWIEYSMAGAGVTILLFLCMGAVSWKYVSPRTVLWLMVWVVGIGGVYWGISNGWFGDENKPIFVPRYLGVVWPGMAIAVAGLLWRIRWKPLRWSAIGLVLLVNVVQSEARLIAGTEPPTERMVHDTISNGKTRVYFNFERRSGWCPGAESMDGSPGWYYRAVEANNAENAAVSWRVPLEQIAAEARGDTGVGTIILWDRFGEAEGSFIEQFVPIPVVDERDELVKLLDRGWKLRSEEEFTSRYFWQWKILHIYRRREYVRESP